ncbi:MAG: 50S ribosomal protein L32, partial [Candidatus Omnitrophota bacterium]
MAVPRGKHTKGKRGGIRMHHFIKEPFLISCPKCGVLKKPHFVCESCGYYKKEEVIN